MPNLDHNKIPSALVPLIPFAVKWGIGDDYEREEAITKASTDELETLIHSIDTISDKDLFGWLSGPESYSPTPSPEYLAFTALTMAIDLAKLRLRQKRVDK
jgi:hypothetical protein